MPGMEDGAGGGNSGGKRCTSPASADPEHVSDPVRHVCHSGL